MAVEEKPTDDAVVYGKGEGTPLPRPFVVEASGPATMVRYRGDVTERSEVELTISHDVTTLEEFGEWWALRNKRFPRKQAIGQLLEDQTTDGVGYTVDADQREAWDVQIDGHAKAFLGVGKTIVNFGGDLEKFDAPNRRFLDRLANNIGKDADELVVDFAADLESCELWGPGARIARLTVEHGNRNDLEHHVEALLEEVRE